MPDIERCLLDIVCALSDAGRAQLAELLDSVAVALQAQVNVLTSQLSVFQAVAAVPEAGLEAAEQALEDALSPLAFLSILNGQGCAQFGDIAQTIRDGLGITYVQSQLDYFRDGLARIRDEIDRIQRLVNKYTQFVDDLQVIRDALLTETCA